MIKLILYLLGGIVLFIFTIYSNNIDENSPYILAFVLAIYVAIPFYKELK